MLRYSQNPVVHYLRISDDEVVVKGSHLEGFSLVVSDESGRGLAGRVLDVADRPVTAQEVVDHLAHDIQVELTEIEDFLDEFASTGAMVRHDTDGGSVAAWLAFLRYGRVESSALRHEIVVAGGSLARSVLQDFVGESRYVDLAALSDLSEFTIEDTSRLAAQKLQDASQDGVREEDVPDDDRPRLVVVTDGVPMTELYRINELAVAAGAPVLYAQAAGVEWAVGPYVVPGSTGCFWEFERQRARSLFSYSEYAMMSALGGAAVLPDVTARAAVRALYPFLVELAMLGRSTLAGHVLRGRSTTVETSRHGVMRLPRCPVCLPTRPLLRNPLF